METIMVIPSRYGFVSRKACCKNKKNQI